MPNIRTCSSMCVNTVGNVLLSMVMIALLLVPSPIIFHIPLKPRLSDISGDVKALIHNIFVCFTQKTGPLRL